ncbi:MAG: hypothetical protein ACR2LH_00340 [Thermoleophilaceae bacterium]
MKDPAVRVFAGGTLAAALIAAAGFLFANPPECPLDYTQKQVDASGCNIGANIGLALILLSAWWIWIFACAKALGMAFSRMRSRAR